MAGEWSGFTDEDLARMRNGETDSSKEVNMMKTRNKPATPKKGTSQISGLQADQPGSKSSETPKTASSKGSPTHVTLKVKEGGQFEIEDVKPLHVSTPETETTRQNSPENASVNGSSLVPSEPSVDETLQQKKERLDLVEFERRQKLIEEQNRIKRDMLRKALDVKKKKTAAEAMKLQQIQEEFSRLNSSLQNDVSILREHIEVASAELAEAEKRYDKAEREFVAAKQLLFSKRERKELLTEHLFTIIEQNEMKKAQRLTELMCQLNEETEATQLA